MRTPSRNFWQESSLTSPTCPEENTWVPQQAQVSAPGKETMRTWPVRAFLLRYSNTSNSWGVG